MAVLLVPVTLVVLLPIVPATTDPRTKLFGVLQSQ